MEEKKNKAAKTQGEEMLSTDPAVRAEKLNAKLRELVEFAKKKKNILEYQEINDR